MKYLIIATIFHICAIGCGIYGAVNLHYELQFNNVSEASYVMSFIGLVLFEVFAMIISAMSFMFRSFKIGTYVQHYIDRIENNTTSIERGLFRIYDRVDDIYAELLAVRNIIRDQPQVNTNFEQFKDAKNSKISKKSKKSI